LTTVAIVVTNGELVGRTLGELAEEPAVRGVYLRSR
jgi:hypothetical protein